MRMWLVPTNIMCQQHLLGEHVEEHMMIGVINKNISIKGYIERGLFDTLKIKQRHKELVNEMNSRGINHKSPLPKFKIKSQGKIDVKANLVELSKRCKDCRKLILKNKLVGEKE